MKETPKLPETGDKYRSVQYRGRYCKVICLFDDQLLFQWLGQDAYLDEQTATIKDFLTDFRFVKAGPRSAGNPSAGASP